MGRRRRQTKTQIVMPDIPLEVQLALDEPLRRVDALIKQMEEALVELKGIRLFISRRRDRDRVMLLERQAYKR